MQVHGLPDNFWVVTYPTANSHLCDISFECDFERFALQIRGGLDKRTIVGIFAVESEAVELAKKLLQTIQQASENPDLRTHKSPWAEWYASQESTAGVFIINKATGEQVFVEPPKEWGHNWNWNITPDGTGIVMRRTP